MSLKVAGQCTILLLILSCLQAASRSTQNEMDRDELENFENATARTWTVYWDAHRKKVSKLFDSFEGSLNFDEATLQSLKLSSSTINQLRNVKGRINTKQGQLKMAVVNVNSANVNFNSRPANTTCSRTENYTCTELVTVPHYTYCTFLFSRRPCTLFHSETRETTCQREVEMCCEGYEVGPSGSCERVFANEDSGCGGSRYLQGSTGILKSPGYPTIYNSSLTCKWTIRASRTQHIIFRFMDLHMEDPVGVCDLRRGNCFSYCHFDRLRFHDQRNNATRNLCGVLVPQSEIFYSSTTVDITFKSDSSEAGRGFKVAYSIVEGTKLRPQSCDNGQEWKLCPRICKLTCEATISSEFGEWNICIKSDGTNSITDTSSKNDITCMPGCTCPDDKPVWHRGGCVKIEQCPQSVFKCGIPIQRSAKKILGGRSARLGAWPWMAQMVEDDLHSCGATLICSNWLITAAHCFLDKTTWSMPEYIDREKYWFHVGKHWKYNQNDERRIQSFRAARIIVHPNYDFQDDLNDIALIQLSGYVLNFDHARPICLPSPLRFNSEQHMNESNGFPGVGDTCMVTGWGITRDIGPSSNRLKELSMPIKPGAQCSYHVFIWRKIICAGGNLFQDTCKGDSGGPLLCIENSRWHLRGITSFGDDCGKGKPGGYTRVSNYISWIRRIVGLHCGR